MSNKPIYKKVGPNKNRGPILKSMNKNYNTLKGVRKVDFES